MNTGQQTNKVPNYTRRMLWVFAGQMILVTTLFVWSDFFPAWLNRVIVVSVILFPPLAYLSVFTRPSMRQSWRDLLVNAWKLFVFIIGGFFQFFRPTTVMKLVRLIASLKPMPVTVDEWITCCLLPFKTCVVATFPMIWTFEKIVSHFQPYRRLMGMSYGSLFQCYLISLSALLFGAALQAIFCRAGRATMTLRLFLLGLVLLLVLTLIPRVIS